ncbi:DUF1294 domain-containing protein [Sulfurimonas aquatica]|uniref:DUF1294 domain-containing protein n=1 Tax=Sulfurimonas aquatica TaxID=2672570 RepID=A0A975AZE8_9BACT|nr:DUF1294 domain-containing protein [Sulfurimonas aquatica]QSZ41338.1 DUF1294 domain-containing protein [Sulfurimonas aquatica]
MQTAIFIYFIFVNIAAFVVYTFDKFRSRVGASRISEKELHTFSLIGGFLGATLSMALFHHKVSKVSFLLIHIAIMILWIALILYYFTQIDELNFIS